MTCETCSYHYKDTSDAYAHCHCTDDITPCEYEDLEREKEQLDEYGY